MKYTGEGPIPDNHPRRCQAANREGLQCKRWALKGSEFCKRHGGSRLRSRTKLGNYYSKYAGKKLAEFLEEASKQNDDDRLRLADEIDVARMNTARAIAIFDQVVINENFVDSNGKPIELDLEKKMKFKSMASEAVKQGLDQVSSLVQAMSKVEALKADKISVNNIKWFADRIMRLIEDNVKDQEQAKILCEKISQIRYLDSGTTNTKVVVTI